ncbi:Hypothetical predicted protein, partial [Drosophila guanche]
LRFIFISLLAFLLAVLLVPSPTQVINFVEGSPDIYVSRTHKTLEEKFMPLGEKQFHPQNKGHMHRGAVNPFNTICANIHTISRMWNHSNPNPFSGLLLKFPHTKKNQRGQALGAVKREIYFGQGVVLGLLRVVRGCSLGDCNKYTQFIYGTGRAPTYICIWQNGQRGGAKKGHRIGWDLKAWDCG